MYCHAVMPVIVLVQLQVQPHKCYRFSLINLGSVQVVQCLGTVVTNNVNVVYSEYARQSNSPVQAQIESQKFLTFLVNKINSCGTYYQLLLVLDTKELILVPGFSVIQCPCKFYTQFLAGGQIATSVLHKFVPRVIFSH